MHSTNYRETLILPSPDCSADKALVPAKPGTVAALQHGRLNEAPYGLTSDDLLFGVYAERNSIGEAEQAAAREAFFSKGQACLRASPLVKSFGWALHHDREGRVALVDPNSAAFAALQSSEAVTKLTGMRSKRAGG